MSKRPINDLLGGATTPATAQVEAHTHRRALLRGRAILSLGLALLIVFGALTALIAGLKPEQFDLPITQQIQQLNTIPWLANLLIAVSEPGFAPWSYVVPALLALAWLVARRFAEALFLVGATLCTGAAEEVKAVIHRARPTDALVHVIHNTNLDGSSFPSSHVVEYTLVFGFCFYLLATLLKPGAGRAVGLALCAALVILVGPSRIAMGQHWASDVLGGYALGFGLLLVVVWAYRGWEARLAALPSVAG
ncbi:MAG: phosphatase PAP2 family protein [Chloroflexota bacterium]|nr:phosphatase PAP2 family protein [Chloroflexota bacterium]